MDEKLAYLALVLVAIGCSLAFPRDQRRSAVLLAVALLVNWLLIEFTYTAYSPHLWAKSHGYPLEARNIWVVLDATVGALALGLAWQWPRLGWALWGICMVQMCLYIARDSGLSSGWFLWGLDKALLAMIAVFILGGGRGVGEAVRRGLDRIGHVFRSPRTAPPAPRQSEDR